MTHRYAIVAPPPTPNGDLHVGHIAGPYFGADVLQRYLKLRGQYTTSALSVDVNQSYVVTTAERLRTDPIHLAQKSHEEISGTLRSSAIEFDVFGIPDMSYENYVIGWFTQLNDSGAFVRRTRTVPYDLRMGRFLFESYASGRCPVCIALTRGNICESCGHPNDAKELIGLRPSGGGGDEPLEMRETTEYVLPLEQYREDIWQHLHNNIPERRPSVQRMLDELFACRLPDFPITFKSNWGVPAPFPDADGLAINVWAEMVPGHYHWLSKASRGNKSLLNGESAVRYVQFLGFDNSFFYCVAHVALAIAARRVGMEHLLPTAFVVNEFYLMENFKFSTSEGHLIWARDILGRVDRDELRFYLAWSNPEYNQANFTTMDFEKVVVKKLRDPYLALISALSKQAIDISRSPDSRALLNRFASGYCPDRFSLRLVARAIANGLDLALDSQGHERTAIAATVALGMAPIMPDMADRLWRASGQRGPLDWPVLQEV